MKIILDARQLHAKEQAHTYLKEQFGFPQYYGHNLDALHDCLEELEEEIEIEIEHWGSVDSGYQEQVVQVMEASGIQVRIRSTYE